jgi:hypothetical protein
VFFEVFLTADAEGGILKGGCCLNLPPPPRVARSMRLAHMSVILSAEILPEMPYSLKVTMAAARAFG